MLKKSDLTNSEEIWAGLNNPKEELSQDDIVVFGIPFDKGVSYRGGAGEAPKLLRANTKSIAPTTEHFESIEDLTIVDIGDFVEEDRDVLFSEIENKVAELVKNGIFFTMVGGDHSVTIPVERGVNKGTDKQFGIIHIDAHFDLCDTLSGDYLSHGSVQRRALEMDNIDSTDNLYFIGIRSIEIDELKFKNNNNINVKSASDCYREGIEKVLKDVICKMESFDKIYLTIDIDCLDPAYASGTGTPQFGGLTSRQLLDLLRGIFDNLNIIGFDVVEVAPKLDDSLTSMFAARKIITECWGHHYRKNLK